MKKLERIINPSLRPEENRNDFSDDWPIQRRAMATAIIGQCFGSLAPLAFNKGLILAYLTSRDVGDWRTMVYLSIPSILSPLLLVLGFAGDSLGKKRIGLSGGLLEAAGFALLALSTFTSEGWGAFLPAAGIIVWSFGALMFLSTWFGLMHPVVPFFLRGRFWGKLRLSWQIVAIAFFLVVSFGLGENETPESYRFVFLALVLALLVRIIFYYQIPELDMLDKGSSGFFQAIRGVFRAREYMFFCGYIFVLCAFTRSCPMLFGMIEKKVVLLSGGYVVGLGVCMMTGSVAGFFVAGKLIDHYGTKPVLTACHFGYAVSVLGFVVRGLIPAPVVMVLAFWSFAFGLVLACSSISMTATMLYLVPQRNKALGCSFCIVALTAGLGVGGLINAGVIRLGLLADVAENLPVVQSQYAGLLVIYSIIVLFLTAALKRIPNTESRAHSQSRQGG